MDFILPPRLLSCWLNFNTKKPFFSRERFFSFRNLMLYNPKSCNAGLKKLESKDSNECWLCEPEHLPALPALKIAWTSDTLNARLYTETSSINPGKNSVAPNRSIHAPSVNGASLVDSAPEACRTTAPRDWPSIYNFTLPESSLVAAT